MKKLAKEKQLKNNSSQMLTGKAFEFAILNEFNEKLCPVTSVKVIKNAAYKIAKECFETFDKSEQGRYLLSASFAVNFLMDIEPRLSNGIGKKDILQIEILTDPQGQIGDVRDVLVIRSLQKWEIGISAKNNHHAVKHSRLSNDIDFGKKWLGVNSSKNYFDAINPIFNSLAEMRTKSKSKKRWDTLGDYHKTIYKPILDAFKDELLRIYNSNQKLMASKLVEYLVGNKDFYKVIKSKGHIEIQAFNLHGTLNLPFEDIKPKFETPKVKLPSIIRRIAYKENSSTTLIVSFNEGWILSFRIHNASSRIEPSLKFDINLLSVPHSLFTNKLSLKVK